MENTATTAAPRDRIALRRLWWVAPLAAVVAAGVNALIYIIASALGAMPDDVQVSSPTGEDPITLAPVIMATVVGALIGAGVFALIGWLTSRPIRIFRIVAVVALILSLFSPFSISDAPADMVLSLVLMHVAAAIVIVGLLTTLVRQEER